MKLIFFQTFLTFTALALIARTLLHRSPSFLLLLIGFALFLITVMRFTRISSVSHRIECELSGCFVPAGIFLWGPEIAPAIFLHVGISLALLGRWKVLAPASSSACLGCYCGGTFYALLCGPPGVGGLTVPTLSAMAAAFVVMKAIDIACSEIYLSLREGTRPFRTAHNLIYLLPDALLLPVNILLFLIWTNWGPSYCLLLVAPLFAAIWIVRMAFRSSEEKDELNILYRFGTLLENCTGRREVLRFLADSASGSRIVPNLLAARLDKEKNALVPVEGRGLFTESRAEGIPIQGAPWPQVLQGGKPLIIGDLTGHHFRHHLPGRIQSLLVLPLIHGQDAEGALLAGHESPDFFHEDHKRFFSVMAGQAAGTLTRLDLYDRLVTSNQRLQDDSLRVREEIELARKVQIGLLPREIRKIPGYEVAFTAAQAGEVGGDYCDFAYLSPTRIAIAIGDVMGKGLPAALLMAITKSVFLAKIALDDSPAVILGRMNRDLCEMVKSGYNVAFSLGILDLEERVFTFANGGQTFPLKRCGRRGSTEFLELGGMPLGIRMDARYQDIRIDLHEEMLLFFYTDGVIEAMDQNGEFFGFERLTKFSEDREILEADRFIRDLSEAVSHFKGDAPQNDDMTMVALRVLPNPLGAAPPT